MDNKMDFSLIDVLAPVVKQCCKKDHAENVIVNVIFVLSYMSGNGCFSVVSIPRAVKLNNLVFQRRGIRALTRAELRSVSIEYERRHRAHSLGSRSFRALVDVDFQEHGVTVFSGQLLKYRSYSLTGAAPKFYDYFIFFFTKIYFS